jgi:hypothetical protein
MAMKALVRHELQASRMSRPQAQLVLVGMALCLIWLFSTQWPTDVLYGAAIVDVSMLWATFFRSAHAVTREWQSRTGHLWLRMQPSASIRLFAKGLAALWQPAAVYALAAIVGLAILVLYRPNVAGHDLPLLVGHAHTAAAAAVFALRWLVPDVLLLFAFAPPLAALGLGLGLVTTGSVPIAGRYAVNPWLLWLGGLFVLWALIHALTPHMAPLFRVARHGESRGLYFTAAGRLDVVASVLPHVGVTLWPLFALWCVGAVVFVLSVRHLGTRLARG